MLQFEGSWSNPADWMRALLLVCLIGFVPFGMIEAYDRLTDQFKSGLVVPKDLQPYPATHGLAPSTRADGTGGSSTLRGLGYAGVSSAHATQTDGGVMINRLSEPVLFAYGTAREKKGIIDLVTSNGETVRTVSFPRRDGDPDVLYVRSFVLEPDGSGYALFQGQRVVKFGPDDAVQWTAPVEPINRLTVHDGRVYTLRIDASNDDEAELVVLNSQDGTVLQTYSLTDGIQRSAYRTVMTHAEALHNQVPQSDRLHPNSVQVLDRRTADAFGFARPGDVLVSFRYPSSYGLYRPAERQFVWMETGRSKLQHSVKAHRDGTISLFNNLYAASTSQLLHYNPSSERTVFSTTTGNDRPLYTGCCGHLQVVSDGYVATVTEQARLVKYDGSGAVTFEYVSPYTMDYQTNAPYRSPLYHGQQFRPDYFTEAIQ